jgi:ATP-dependent exoDNAse (exonuclease V) beta subunit
VIEKLEYFKDPNFKFDEDTHTYTYCDASGKPIQFFQSVTQFISTFKKPFDSDFWANKKAKQLGVHKSVILNEWKNTADIAVKLGSNVHKWIELYYNGENPPLPEHPEENFRVSSFLDLYEKRLNVFKPIGQEIRLFSRKWGIAGTTDALFELTQKYYVGDYKTNKKFTTDADPKGRYSKLLWPFDDLWDNSLNGYSIQLSMYRLMLEEAGFETHGSFLIWIGPSKPMLYKSVDLRDRLRIYLEKNTPIL